MTSILLQQSPATVVALTSLFADELGDFEVAFDFALQHGASREWPVERAPGASFNPRPCRIMQIIMREAKTKDRDLLLGSVLASVEDTELLTLLREPKLLRAIQIARAALRGDSSAETAIIRLALLLDQARHLHMTFLSSTERRQRAMDILKLCDELPINSLEADSCGSSLARKVKQAVERYIRTRVD